MGEKKYNHFVPKFYLSNFSGNKKCVDKCIISSGKVIRNAALKTTGGQYDLYGKDPFIEKKLSEMEGIWANEIRDIITTEAVPTDPYDVEDLLYFVAISDARTQVVAEKTIADWGQLFQIIARMYIEHGKWDIPEYMIPCIGAEADVPNMSAFRSVRYIVEAISDLKIGLIKNISNVEFITSDCPVAKYNQLLIDRQCRKGYGYGDVGLLIFLPISPRLCLTLYDPHPYNVHRMCGKDFVLKSDQEVLSLNKLFLGYANKEIYFGNGVSDRTIRKLLEKRPEVPLLPSRAKFETRDSSLLFVSVPSYWHNIGQKIFTTKKSWLS